MFWALLARLVYLTHLWAVLFFVQSTGWSVTTLAWESLRLGLGRDWTPSFIFRTLSPICILSIVGYLFAFAVLRIFVMYQLYLDSFESFLYIYIFQFLLWILSWTVVMLSQFHPHNAHVSACTLCLVGVLRSLLCGLWRERLNLHSIDFGASQVVSEPRFRNPYVFSIQLE